ncbi:MAG: zinc-binding dehydrogenase [Ethanoligenens sp.]
MRSVVIAGKRNMSVAENPAPAQVSGTVLVAPKYVGICGSDLHYYYDGAVGAFAIREPLTPGHEVSGVLAEDTVVDGKTIPTGTPVAIHPSTWGTPVPGLEDKREVWPGGRYLGSAATMPHTQGAMTERLAVRPDQLRVLPDTLPLKRGALAEPLGVALHGLSQAGDVRGKRVLVSGSGPIGLLAVAAASAQGAKEIAATDLLSGPLERAKALGATQTIQLGQGAEVPQNAFDVVLECSGTPGGVTQAFLAIAPGGVIVQVGMLKNEASAINLSSICAKEVTLRGTFRFDREFDDAIRMLDENPSIENVITHVFPIDEVENAFAVAHDAQVSGKVLIAL